MIERLRGFARARVARRLFFLFVLSAFVPLAVVAMLTMTQVRSLLLQQGDQRMGALAKAYGMTIFERLLLASEVGAAASERELRPDGLAARVFHSLVVIDVTGVNTPVLGTAAFEPPTRAQRERLATGKVAVSVEKSGDRLRILLLSPIPGPEWRIAAGELRADYLWGPADEAPALTDFCIAEESTRAVLHCANPASRSVVTGMAPPAGATQLPISWVRDGERMRSRSWAQFMRAQFGTPDWVIVASQPEATLLSRVDEFRQLFIPVVVLAILLVTWFTIRQSRQVIAPLTELGRRVRGIANNEFKGRIDSRRTDEFGALANAFDAMTGRLGSQFASLTALSEIDRLILSTQDIAQVIRTVLARMNEVVACDWITITLLEHDNADHARTYFLASGESGSSASMRRHEIDAGEREDLAREPGGVWVPLGKASVPRHLAEHAAQGMGYAMVQPIIWRGAVCGALVLGYRADHQISPEERQRTRELADRVAVAVSSAWRDEQLYLQAHFDTLTGMPNRLLFKDRLDIEIARSRREDLRFALLFIDLDHFKTVNDSLGHAHGDLVLREAARRIAQCVRGSDTVGRQGGDEFTVLLTNLGHPKESWLIAETIVATLSRPFAIGGHDSFLGASIGIASFPQDGSTADLLLKCADTAMYRAKAAGRGQALFYEERMNAEAVARLTLDRDLRLAIERGELTLHYQPQVEMATGAVHGAEALLRWTHPLQGPISPTRFIPLAEESGFIDALGQWTLEQAALQMRRWRDAGLPLLRVSVNVSPRQFRKPQLVEIVRASAASAGIPAACLEIEITEGLLLDRGEAVEAMLRELAAAGHLIALDDFGTGFSSMAYLERLPVDAIKIDRVFVAGLSRGAGSEAIVAAIIALSHALGKRVIAEGAETPAQLATLRKLGCDEVQGYVHSRALPAGEFERWVRASSVATNPALQP